MWHIQYNLSQSVVTAESIASRQLPSSPKLSGFKGHDTLTICLVDTNQGVQARTLHIRCGRQFLKKHDICIATNIHLMLYLVAIQKSHSLAIVIAFCGL